MTQGSWRWGILGAGAAANGMAAALQAGSFRRVADAERLKGILALRGLEAR